MNILLRNKPNNKPRFKDGVRGKVMNTIDDNRVIDKYLTLKEASLVLNVHVNTLRRWGDEGKVKYLRINIRGDRRFAEGDIRSVQNMMHDNQGYF
jgi:excisionase family DNA binding protein